MRQDAAPVTTKALWVTGRYSPARQGCYAHQSWLQHNGRHGILAREPCHPRDLSSLSDRSWDSPCSWHTPWSPDLGSVRQLYPGVWGRRGGGGGWLRCCTEAGGVSTTAEGSAVLGAPAESTALAAILCRRSYREWPRLWDASHTQRMTQSMGFPMQEEENLQRLVMM